MFISIITPTFNSEKTLKNCLTSVKNQKFEDYEHIIIDNCSNDKTIQIIKKFNNTKLRLISEDDKGIYDGMNKGISKSFGDYLLFLNSDDQLIDQFFLFNVNKILSKNKIDILYSNIIYKKNLLGLSRKYIVGDVLNVNKFGNHIPHPGTLIKKKYLINMEYFDLKYKISSDFDFFIRAKKNKNTSYYYYNKFTVLMSPGGASSGFQNIVKANIECFKSLRKNKVRFPLIFIMVKLLRKFSQLL